jgi:hypothetical protein
MPKNLFVPLLFLFLFHSSLLAQNAKELLAVKVAVAPKIDGLLNDNVWQNAPVATDFIVTQPLFGGMSSQKSTVKIVYDNSAIYVAAYLYDNPDLIRKQLTPRDGEQRQDVDVFSVAFDTYNDNQNGFQFIVTASNVQSDARISATGNNNGIDYNWDAVWESKTSITKDGWVVEMKIPFYALRFAKNDLQDWGINFSRLTRRLNENSNWNPVNPNVNGFVNQMGDLKGLENLTPPLRLSFQPYMSTGYRIVPTKNGTEKNFLRNGGMDVKYGVNESFTLDMTLVPDFGQVASDNIILNLSPFEQQFSENRSFFTEGTELFNKAGIFYSRRIGATPLGYFAARRLAVDSSYEIIRNPTATQLYNATKFSGRNKNNLGIGIFNAVTAPMYAEFKNSKGEKVQLETEPLANYNIVVFDQAFKNRSFVTFTNTNVMRNGSARDANVSAIDVALFDKRNLHRLQAKARYSNVWEKEHYDGYRAFVEYEKISGKIQYSASQTLESVRYDINDLGIIRAANEHKTFLKASYNQFTPTKKFNFYFISLQVEQQNLYKPYLFQSLSIRSNALFVFKNFWDINVVVDGRPKWTNDFFELRVPGRRLKRAPFYFARISGSTDSRKKLLVRYAIGYADSHIKDDALKILDLGFRYRFNPRFSIDMNTNRQEDFGNFGFSNFDATTREPVLGKRHLNQYNNQLSGIYHFTPRMNVTFRSRHYWSKVRYTNFYNVKSDGYWTERPFQTGRDQNFNAFNIDMFYTWDVRPGSRLIVAWKNALGPDAFIDGKENTNYASNFGRLVTVPHTNELSVKFVYFIDYLQLKKKA